ncbi:MAG: hypothetical protein E7058_01155 [Lentisphaerae bacterium]|nr:hypothetical protein [Lentisphaerota bacterium]
MKYALHIYALFVFFLLTANLFAAPKITPASYRFSEPVIGAKYADISFTKLTDGKGGSGNNVIWNCKILKKTRVVITFQFTEDIKLEQVTFELFRGARSFGLKDVTFFGVDGNRRVPLVQETYKHPYNLPENEKNYQTYTLKSVDNSPFSTIEAVFTGTGSYLSLCEVSFFGSTVPRKQVQLPDNPLDKLQKSAKNELRMFKYGERFVMENSSSIYVIDPRCTGAVVYAFDKVSGQNHIRFAEPGGDYGPAFVDRFYTGKDLRTQRDVFRNVRFEAEIISDTPAKKQLRVSGNGKSGAFANVRIDKIYTLTPDSSVLRIDYAIHNALENVVPLKSGFWCLSGVQFADGYNRIVPGLNGVESNPGGVKEFSTRDLSSNWYGAVKDDSGIAFIAPNELLKEVCFWSSNPLYGTAEHKLGIYPIAAGSSLEFTMFLAPFAKVGTPDKVSPVAATAFDLQPEYTAAPKNIKFNAAFFEKGRYTVKISGGVCGKDGKVKFRELASFKVNNQPFFSKTFANDLRYGTVVYKVEIFNAQGSCCHFAEKSVIYSKATGIYQLQSDGERKPDASGSGEKLDLNFNSKNIGGEFFDFSSKFAGQAPRVLAVNPVAGGIRDMIEVSRRFDMDLTTNYIAGLWSLSGHVMSLNTKSCVNELTRQLKKDYNCLVLAGDVWKLFDQQLSENILSKVAGGCGLVLISPEGFPEALKKHIKLLPGKPVSYPWQSQNSGLLAGIPLNAVTSPAIFRYEFPGAKIHAAANGFPVIAEFNYGKGKVFVCTWQNSKEQNSKYNVPSRFFLPYQNSNVPQATWKYYEYQIALLGKLIYAAGKTQSGVNTVDFAPADTDMLIWNVESDRKQDVEVTVTCRNKFSEKTNVFSRKTTLIKGKNVFIIAQHNEMRGMNFADVVIRNSKGTLCWASCAVDNSQDHTAGIKQIQVEEKIRQPDEILPVSVIADGGQVIMEMFDNNGNCFAKSTGNKAGFDLADCRTKTAQLVVRLMDNGKEIDRQIRRIAIAGAPDPRIFTVMQGWPSISTRAHVWNFKLYLEQLKKFGVNIAGGANSYRDLPAAEAAFRDNGILFGSTMCSNSIGGKHPILNQGTKEKDKMLRTPCLSDPQFRKTIAAVPKSFGVTYPFGVLDVAGPDESNMISEWDGCFSEHCKKEFRKYLKTQYASLEDLNRAWATDFKQWDDVVASTAAEARKMKSFASWLDHRTFNDVNRAYALGLLVKGINAKDPELTYSLSGTSNTNAWNAWDYYLMMPYLRALSGYTGEQSIQHRSFATGKLRNCPWVGYDQNFDESNYRIFNAIMEGASGVSIYGNFNIDPAYEISPGGKELIRALDRYRNGAAEAVMTSLPNSGGVAFHYTPASIKADWFIGLENLRISSTKGFRALIHDLGIEYDYVAYGQLEKSGMPAKYKVFIMPMSSALSDAEARAIADFVRNGGTVIADLMPGYYDQHGVRRTNSIVKEIFGMENIGMPERTDIPLDYQDKVKMKISYYDPAARPSTASPLAAVGGKGAVFVNSYGKGKAIYMACSATATFGDWEIMRYTPKNKNSGLFLAGIIKDAFSKHNIRALATAPGMPLVQMISRRINDGFLLGVLRDPAVANSLPQVKKKHTLFLDDNYFIYDVVTRKYLGSGSRFDHEFEPCSQNLFALLPYRVTDIKCQVAKNGGKVKLSVTAGRSDSAAQWCDHIFQVRIFSPDGKENPSFSQLLFAQGNRGEMIFKLPLNMPQTGWKAEVQCVLTGTKSTVLW